MVRFFRMNGKYLFDAHFHWKNYEDTLQQSSGTLALPLHYTGMVSLHDQSELDWMLLHAPLRPHVVGSCGIHPQQLQDGFSGGLSGIVAQKPAWVQAIGECGFDFFTARSHEIEQEQCRVFEVQVALALEFRLPMVIHIRRATDMIFRYTRQLKQLPAVMFHAWGGPLNEALSLLRQGVNAWFSFGTPLLWQAKKASACVCGLPIRRILIETDMPWQPRWGFPGSGPADLELVYEQVCRLTGLPPADGWQVLMQNWHDFWL